MIEHFVEVRVDEKYLEKLAQYRPITDEDRADAYVSRLICSDPANCPGFRECLEPHVIDGVDASEGPWDTDCECSDWGYCSSPWCEEDEFEFHGVLHTWQYGYGWTVEYSRCPVVDNYMETPDGIPMDRPGKYKVDIEWDDESCYVVFAGDQ